MTDRKLYDDEIALPKRCYELIVRDVTAARRMLTKDQPELIDLLDGALACLSHPVLDDDLVRAEDVKVIYREKDEE